MLLVLVRKVLDEMKYRPDDGARREVRVTEVNPKVNINICDFIANQPIVVEVFLF